MYFGMVTELKHYTSHVLQIEVCMGRHEVKVKVLAGTDLAQKRNLNFSLSLSQPEKKIQNFVPGMARPFFPPDFGLDC